MKKKAIISASIAIAALMTSSFAIGVFAASDIKLFINGRAIDTPIEVIDGSSYVPLRVVSESLGADVKWDGDARTITITGKGEAAAVSDDVKAFDVNVDISSGPMKMKISKVTLDPTFKSSEYSPAINAVILDVEAENTSADTVNWYPNQGTIVLNTKEQTNGALFHSDDVGGEFIGKVIKSGKIVFEVKSKLGDISSINFSVDGPFNSDSFTRIGEDKKAEIILN